MVMDISKAIIPAAGLGTCFLSFTKTIPKEMLPLMNKPAIQFSVEEGLQSGINHFTIVTNKGKQVIADHFDASPELNLFLKERHKEDILSSLNHIINTTHFTYVRQPEPFGLGHEIWLPRHTIGKEYFGIFLPDEIILGKPNAFDQLVQIARQEKASVIAVQEVPAECVSSYGIISIRKQITPSLFHVNHLVEKPDQKNAPSNLAVIGRYILSHKVFAS